MEDVRQRSGFERLLSLLTPVHAGEGRCVAALCLQAFLLMVAYYLLRPVREALILTEGDAELRSYAVGVQAVLLLMIVPLYGLLIRRSPSRHVFRCVIAFFVVNLFAFFLLGQAGLRVGFCFFVWVGLFSVMAVTQFWAFATDLFTPSSGKRLFGVIAIGVSAGAWAGAQLAAAGFEWLGPYGLMLAAAGVLGASVWVSGRVGQHAPASARREQSPDAPAGSTPSLDAAGWLGGFALVARSHYLAGVAALVVLLNWITSTGDYLLAHWLVEVAGREAPGEQALFIGRFMGRFCSMITLAAFVTQLLLVSRIIVFAGLARALLVTPVALVAGYLFVGILPLFMVLHSVLILQRSLDYSLMNTTRHALLLVGSRREKYEAKTAIDTFFFRFGDLLSALSIFVGLRLFGEARYGFVWLVFVLSLTLMVVAWLVGREYLCRSGAPGESGCGGAAVGGRRPAVAVQ